jgi:hypothetical protein
MTTYKRSNPHRRPSVDSNYRFSPDTPSKWLPWISILTIAGLEPDQEGLDWRYTEQWEEAPRMAEMWMWWSFGEKTTL